MKEKNKPKKDEKLSNEAKIARFFGFKKVAAPELIKADFDVTKKLEPSNFPEEKAAVLRMYFEEKKNGNHSVGNIYIEKPFPGSKDNSKKSGKLDADLFSISSPKYVSECLLIMTSMEVLEEIGHKDLEVRINSIGDKDSINSFQRNLTSYIRKNISLFPADLRQTIKKDQFVLLREKHEGWEKFQNECPKPVDFLSEASRTHFKQVLEFLEVMNINYSLDHSLLGDFEIGSETVFAIENTERLAYGFRLNRLAKKIGYKKDLPACFVNISAKIIKQSKTSKVSSGNPKFFLIQFGNEARLQSFLILRQIFNAKVNILHLLEKDRLDEQMYIAEKSGVPYIMLVGQKEALDQVVVIRNVATRSQETIPLSLIADKAKELS